MIYDTDEAYRSVNDAISLFLSEKNNTVTSQHSVTPTMPDTEVENIFLQVRKYARGRWSMGQNSRDVKMPAIIWCKREC